MALRWRSRSEGARGQAPSGAAGERFGVAGGDVRGERELIVGTRGSELALVQTRRVRAGLPGPSRELLITTSGDRFQTVPLHEVGGVGVFTKEIEDRLRSGEIDVAVHSLKDLPTRVAEGLVLAALLARDDPSDVLLVHPGALAPERKIPVADGCTVGASSLRRQALLGLHSPDARAVAIRGNVPTRVDKARRREVDALLLARAGLTRLGLDVAPLVAFDLNPAGWVCAPGQGVIAVETRAGDAEARARLAALDHAETRACAEAERELLHAFGGGCHAPFGAWAHSTGSGWEITVAAPGADAYRVERFAGDDLDGAYGGALRWVTGPRTARAPLPSPEWVCRPARPW
jgi:hydroxymethylbilane synthase